MKKGRQLIEDLRSLVERGAEYSELDEQEEAETDQVIKALRDTDYRDKDAFFKMVQLLKGLVVNSEKDEKAKKFMSAVSDALTSAAKKVLAEEVLTEAMGGQIFVFDKKHDIEFILDPTIGFLQIGMGGEWWSGKVRSGKNVFRHKKERVDPGYATVTVVMRDSGDNLAFDVSGGFGNDGTIVIGGK